MKDEVKQPLALVNGKFMRGGVEESPEIGNPEQIALLQKAERESSEREKRAKSGKLPADIHVECIRYDAVCAFTCVCGKVLKKNDQYRV